MQFSYRELFPTNKIPNALFPSSVRPRNINLTELRAYFIATLTLQTHPCGAYFMGQRLGLVISSAWKSRPNAAWEKCILRKAHLGKSQSLNDCLIIKIINPSLHLDLEKTV